ncbi:MAG: NAD-dependent epimerase/dehydratase family protein, partial [Bacteroidia bacterium]
MPKQQVLIIGGTNFIGRNLVEQLLQLPQFEVTLFNRGKTNPHLFKNVSTIIGNRKRKVDLESLFTHKWDFVIDTSCYFPQDLEWVLEGLGGNYKNY